MRDTGQSPLSSLFWEKKAADTKKEKLFIRNFWSDVFFSQKRRRDGGLKRSHQKKRSEKGRMREEGRAKKKSSFLASSTQTPQVPGPKGNRQFEWYQPLSFLSSFVILTFPSREVCVRQTNFLTPFVNAVTLKRVAGRVLCSHFGSRFKPSKYKNLAAAVF